MTIARFSHVGVCVSDLAAARRFYCDALGFTPVAEITIGGPVPSTLLGLEDVELHAVYLQRDGFRLELLHFQRPAATGEAAPRAMNQLGITHLSLRVSDLDGVLVRLQAHGARVLAASRIDIAQVGAAAVFVTDPDGTLIELVQSPGDPDLLPGQAAC